MKQFEAQLELKIETSLGEGPLWHSKEGKLYFVDIVGQKVFGYNPVTSHLSGWSLPSYVGAIAERGRHDLAVAVKNQLISLNTEIRKQTTLLSLDLNEDIRFNECKCDRLGRYWMGTMHVKAEKGAGAFYRVDLDGSVTQVLSNLSVPNGFCWSLDNKFLYHIDSFDYSVKRFSYDEAEGTISKPEAVITFEENGTVPDGMCMDQRGMLWIAMWGGSKVACYDPTSGQLLAEVKVPAPHVTSCNFGGDNFSTLYITTARLGLTNEQLEEFPLSGSVFSIDVGQKGFELNHCGL